MSARGNPLPGLPDQAEVKRLEKFAGVNQKDARPAIDDQECFWLENLCPIGPGNLRSMWGIGPIFYTAPAGKTIIYVSQFNLGTTSYWAIFLNDGTAWQVNPLGVATQIGASIAGQWPGFYNGTDLPKVAQWGSQYLIIVSNLTTADTGYFQGLFVWDGSNLYGNFYITASAQTKYGNSPFTLLQDGGGDYTSVPTVSADPVFGASVIGTATLTGTKVTKITINSSQLKFPTSALAPGLPPFIPLIFKGGGQGNAAWGTATVNSNGQVTAITLGDSGTSYFDVPTINIMGVGAGASATPVMNATSIAAISMDNTGSGYTAVPAVTITPGVPGAGSGATATANVVNGSVVSITVTAGGSGYTSRPIVTIANAPTGGVTATAHATLTATTVASVKITTLGTGYDPNTTSVQFQGGNGSASAVLYAMPTGVKGTDCESFQSRLWIVDGTNLYVSAPQNAVDFAAADGGLITQSVDPDLRQAYKAVRQSNGFIYLYGDSSISVASGIQSNPVASLQLSTVDAQVGGIYRDSIYPIGRSLVSVGPNGVASIYGGTVKKESDKIDRVFQNANFTNQVPCSAAAIVFGRLIYFALVNSFDITTNVQRTFLICWDGQKWFFSSQEKSLTFITTQEINSQITAWGTDGTNFFQLFAQPSMVLSKKALSKLFWGRSPGAFKRSMIFTGVADPQPQGTTRRVEIVIKSDSYDNDTEVLPFTLNNVLSWVNNAKQHVYWVNG